MSTADDIAWFKKKFHRQIQDALNGTLFSIDLITAIACQETLYIWRILRKRPSVSLERLLELCVGDVIDGSGKKGRTAFPRNKSELLTLPNGSPRPNGQTMFDIARRSLEEMAQETQIGPYLNAVKNRNKFCRGYGIFQYDLQFFKEVDPDYFLERRWRSFDAALGKCIGELTAKLRKIGYDEKPRLTDEEMVHVAIAYNSGRFVPSKGLKQGHFDGRKYYGEYVFDFLRLSKTVPVPGEQPIVQPPRPGEAPVPPSEPMQATGRVYEVETRQSPLNLRSEPEKEPGNVIAQLPDGHLVRAVTNEEINGFLEVETELQGALLHGFAHTDYLKAIRGGPAARSAEPAVAPAAIPAVYAPQRPGHIARRADPATPFTLNEANQPDRKGTTPDELRVELAEIIDWLAVDDPDHERFQPGGGKTFCNIYAHDYCHLTGVYLPRVWWSARALIDITQGRQVVPRLGSTIDEQRANDLFRWLRDFGQQFGWRRASSLNSLQLEVNQGAVGLIVARRVVDGRSGHIVAVVPETPDHRARRNSAGEVTAPLQSQAGATNFRYGNGRTSWWLGAEFAEGAFWLHG